MPKITDEQLEAIQVRLFKADLDYLRSLFKGSFGVNKYIRQVVRAHVTQSRAKAADVIDNAESKIRRMEDLI